jgi:carbon-monoxide dehydrogenase small subunit/xanthine dehydrogenase small subunit
VRFVLNGRSVDVRAHPLKRLVDVLREDCGLTGTKEGCGEGECGACTVLVDGQVVNSCLVPFTHVRGARVTTIEGIRGRRALQDAFVKEGATQCGLCTPGLIVASSTLPRGATREQVRVALAGNLCRCTGYAAIYRAIARAGLPGRSARLRSSGDRARRATARQPSDAAGAKAGGAGRARGPKAR